jgi:hypothetical protein
MSQRLRSAGLALLGVLLLTQGCTLIPDLRKADAPARAQRQLVDQLPEILAYYREASGWPEARLQLERETQRSLLITGQCNLARLKLAAISLEIVEQDASARAPQGLLRPCLKDESLAAGVQGLALLLGSQITQRSTSAAQLRTQTQELETLRRQNLELLRQLEGLKALERSLQQRRR